MTVLVACEYCGGVLEPAIIAGTAAAWGWRCYLLARVFGWIRRPEPEKPPCQSCGSFIFCAIDQVSQCPKLKRPSRFRRALSCLRGRR